MGWSVGRECPLPTEEGVWGEGCAPSPEIKKKFGSMCSKIFCVQAKGGGHRPVPPKYATGPADATAIPKPHCLLPHLNPDWFYLSGTGLA